VRVKVDEDLPGAAAVLLRDRGLDTATVIEQGMCGFKEAALWAAVQAEQRFLVTADKGFADIRIFPPGAHADILLLRPDDGGIRPILELLEKVLSGCDLEHLLGAVAEATPRGIRIRRASLA